MACAYTGEIYSAHSFPVTKIPHRIALNVPSPTDLMYDVFQVYHFKSKEKYKKDSLTKIYLARLFY